MKTSFRIENRPLPSPETRLKPAHSTPSGISSAPTHWEGARKNSGGLCPLVGDCIRRICDFFARLLGCRNSENVSKSLPPMPVSAPEPSLPRPERTGPVQGRGDPLPRSESERLVALRDACIAGDLNALNQELADGHSPINTPFLGGAPLHNAIQNGHLAIFNRLLAENRLNLMRIDMHGRTALHLACELGNLPMMRALLAAGAPTETREIGGQPPLHLACERNQEEVVAEWIRAGGPVDIRNGVGQTALHRACISGHENIVRLLLSANAPLDAVDENGNTPLYPACRSRHLGILQLLLNAHATLDMRNNEGLTPLHIACLHHMPTAGLRALVQAGAPVNEQSHFPYFTPLYCVLDSREDPLERVNVLLDAGANPAATFLKGQISILGEAQRFHSENAALIQRLEQAIAAQNANTPVE